MFMQTKQILTFISTCRKKDCNTVCLQFQPICWILSAAMASPSDIAEGGANEEFSDIIKWRSGMSFDDIDRC